MEKPSNLAEAYSILKARYGSHVAAGRAMKLAPTHYRKLRNGIAAISENRSEYFMLKAKEALAETQAHS